MSALAAPRSVASATPAAHRAARMTAAVYHRYGGPGVVALAEVPVPAVGAHDVRVRIHAAAVTTADMRARSLDLPGGFSVLGRPVFGMFGPRQPILGGEAAGVVEAVGAAVTRFAPGDRVVAYTGAAFGCHAEYRVLREEAHLAKIPAGLSFEAAAALSFGGLTALSFLRDKARLVPGERVLVVGASGNVGSAAVQIAKAMGAHVTGVCSTANADLVRALGADRVIDYTQEDFATTGETWDVILNIPGELPLARCEAALAPGGRLALVYATFPQTLGLERPARGSGKRVVAGVAATSSEDLEFLVGLAASGAYRPVIDRVYPLADAAEAHAYVATGRKRGSVVLAIA